MRELANPVRSFLYAAIAAGAAVAAIASNSPVAAQTGSVQTGAVARHAVAAATRATDIEDPRLAELERTTLDAINDERRRSGLPPLVVSAELCRLARSYSRDMVERRFFDHVDPDGRLVQHRADAVPLGRWTSVGENIARNRGFRDPVEVAVREWMKSQGHRENILDAHYNETGIGVWIAPDKTVYFTQIFLEK